MRKRLCLSTVWLIGICLLSCSSGQQLVSITVAPTAATFGSPVPLGVHQDGIQLTALGTYVHPPATKDLTTQVVWKSNITDVAVIDSTGVLTAGPNCGVAGISASLQTNSPSGNVVVGTMTATVDDVNVPSCPQPTH